MEPIVISKYCIIRDNQLIIDGKGILALDKEISFKEFSKAVYQELKLNYPKFYKMDNLSKLGLLAAEALNSDFNFEEKYNQDRIGIVLQNSSSSLDTDNAFQKTIQDADNFFPSPSVFVYTLPNIVIGEISIKMKITGESIFFISESFDSELMYDYIKQLFETKSIDCCFAGWIDFLNNDYDCFIMFLERKIGRAHV